MDPATSSELLTDCEENMHGLSINMRWSTPFCALSGQDLTYAFLIKQFASGRALKSTLRALFRIFSFLLKCYKRCWPDNVLEWRNKCNPCKTSNFGSQTSRSAAEGCSAAPRAMKEPVPQNAVATSHVRRSNDHISSKRISGSHYFLFDLHSLLFHQSW